MTDPKGPADDPMIIVASSTTLGKSIEDAISPLSIEHRVDEFRAKGELIEYYNYIVYTFERAGLSCQARTYVHSIGEVALLGRDHVPGSDVGGPAAAFREDVLRYLKRRFDKISELADAGYVTVWSRPD